jgi:hypothetical protein
MSPVPSRQDAKRWLSTAVVTAGGRDIGLWERNVGERARVAAIHFALRTIVEREGAGWHVDAEYNKRRDGLKPQPGMTPVTNKHRTGTPDIMIHRRGLDGVSNNLLVVEFKRTYSNLKDRSNDMRKIEYWADEIGYPVGAVVGLGRNGSYFAPKVRWYERRGWSQCETLSG